MNVEYVKTNLSHEDNPFILTFLLNCDMFVISAPCVAFAA